NQPTLFTDPLGLKPSPDFGDGPGGSAPGGSGPVGTGPGGSGPGGNGPGGKGPGGSRPSGPGPRSGRCDAICQMAPDIARRAGKMTELETILEWEALSAFAGATTQAALNNVRVRVHLDPAGTHDFGDPIGKPTHVQIEIWLNGVPGSGTIIRIQ